MSYINQDEIHGILIQTGSERVLLPNAVVAEVMSGVSVESLNDVPSWLVGKIVWYAWKVPLVSFARFIGLMRK